jgi:hypothetical protein
MNYRGRIVSNRKGEQVHLSINVVFETSLGLHAASQLTYDASPDMFVKAIIRLALFLWPIHEHAMHDLLQPPCRV